MISKKIDTLDECSANQKPHLCMKHDWSNKKIDINAKVRCIAAHAWPCTEANEG
jgi:hypothetical protein